MCLDCVINQNHFHDFFQTATSDHCGHPTPKGKTSCMSIAKTSITPVAVGICECVSPKPDLLPLLVKQVAFKSVNINAAIGSLTKLTPSRPVATTSVSVINIVITACMQMESNKLMKRSNANPHKEIWLKKKKLPKKGKLRKHHVHWDKPFVKCETRQQT